MTDESRVLAVLDARRQLNQAQVIQACRMGAYACMDALARLIDLGLVERTTYRSGRAGRPALLYRRCA